MKKIHGRNVVSLGLLAVLLAGLVFTLTGCGFFNKAPTAEISVTSHEVTDNTVSVNTDEEIKFDGSSSYDPDGEITSYSWDFGSNFDSNSTEVNAVQTGSYSVADNYTVKLTVTDDGAKKDTASVDVEVSSSS